MRRATLGDLGAARWDVLVIGGGIYGAMAAREAALRGLRTALVERADFGSGTSQNSLKIMHGGIRYVQHLDFARLRASARERAFWLRAAPDLVRPLKFVIPLVGHGTRGPAAFASVAALYGLGTVGIDGTLPGVRVVGRARAQALLGAMAPEEMTGAGVWHDGQIEDTGRLLMAALRAATQAGALVANYVEAEALLRTAGRVEGAALLDRIAGTRGDVRADITLCCAGPAAAGLTVSALGPEARSRFPCFARAMNLVIDRPAGPYALGVISRSRADAIVKRGGRMYFFVPWGGRLMIGTHESPHEGTDLRDGLDASSAFLDEINVICPGLHLRPDELLHVHRGLIPADVDDARTTVRRLRSGTVIDHEAEVGVGGLISCTGVKYTTARLVAARMVTLVQARLGKGLPPRQGAARSLATRLPVISEPSHAGLQNWAARIEMAVRDEMAMSLDDVLWRRSTIGESGALRGASGMHLWREAACAAQTLGLPLRIAP
ncbi:FAD-dependent oxidoreductase [Limimaricola litoreus]|uniref:FAD-dependent oxidoreductase n=1 Tax=Limimaricola litoreus TaxID=2955316 RepID=A0A9X2JP82_9RHOB|nr:FAD-dependent oxidoreductase [Limimaricola litoreus]